MGQSVWTLIGAASCIGYLSFTIYKLRKDLDKMKELRQAERQGRIRAEKMATQSQSDDNVYKVFPIGEVRSSFAKRSGTPRQPGLVASVESRIEIVPELFQAIDSIGEFSHVWIMFVFHKNTNIYKRLKSKRPFEGLKLLVEPPKAQGRKVGVLSCRTPHRPNPIGLSLCRVVRVDKDAIIVAGLDCLDGSPVLDIKPYLPMIENVPDAKVPDWIYQGVDKDREVMVEWACERAIPGHQDEQKTLRVIEEVLSRDIRSTHQIDIGSQMDEDWTGQVHIGNLTVTYTVNKEKLVRIQQISSP